MKHYIRMVSKINDRIGRITSFLVIPMAMITAFEVISRYVFSKPTIWAWDLNIQLFAFLNLLGGGYTLLHKGHVSVDLIRSVLSPKICAIIDLVTSLLFFVGILVLLIGGWIVGWDSWIQRESMSTLWAPPLYPMKLALPVGAFLVLIQGISLFFENLMIVIGKGE